MGFVQDYGYSTYGKNVAEMIFFSNLLGLPLFLALWSEMQEHSALWSLSPPVVGWAAAMPSAWLFVIANVVTQLACVRGVNSLMAAVGPLAVNFAITLRKFLSLLFSIIYFDNPFSAYHWAGAVLVFFGTIVYSRTASSSTSSPADAAATPDSKETMTTLA